MTLLLQIRLKRVPRFEKWVDSYGPWYWGGRKELARGPEPVALGPSWLHRCLHLGQGVLLKIRISCQHLKIRWLCIEKSGFS